MFGLIFKKNAKKAILGERKYAFIKNTVFNDPVSDDIEDIIKYIADDYGCTFEKVARTYLGIDRPKKHCFVIPKGDDKSLNGMNFANVVNALTGAGLLDRDIDWSCDSSADFMTVWYRSEKDYTAELEKVVKAPMPAALGAAVLPSLSEVGDGL